ncbi:MAG: 50S ribosomal protein L13 [Candidatus Aenigmatarchaeota archaeon]
MTDEKIILIDGDGAILGRLASFSAKRLLNGERVNILNAEKVIITGNPKRIVANYLKKRRRGSPQHGPFFPKKPDLILRRTIRGMLPKTRKGRNALKRLRAYIGIPEEFKDKKFETMATKEIKTDFITLGNLSKSLGWHE